jgi:ABC-2 type transport system permease protein
MNDKVKTIFKKELKSYFISPVAYIVISIFLVMIGWMFFSTFFLEKQANLVKFFSLIPVFFAFVIPAITMRLFSEEINVGSYELLLTLPVSFKDIVMGKFLSAVVFVCIMLLPTLVYAITVSFFGTLDLGPVIGGYFGAILLAAAFSAIGLFTSSLTKNQVVAFIMSMTICFILTVILDFVIFFIPDALVGLFQYASANYHFRNIARGIIDSRDLIYFLSVAFIFLYGANLVMQEKK